jgi:uroporphyrinogen decarboxylase
MDSYTRVAKTLNFEEPDRVPLDVGGTTVSGIHVSTLKKLFETWGYQGHIHMPDPIQQVALAEPSFMGRLGVDTLRIGPDRIPGFEQQVRSRDGVESITDPWGIEWEKKEGEQYFSQVSYPLSGEKNLSRALETYRRPKPRPDRLQPVFGKDNLKEATRFPVLDRDCAGILEMSLRLRGVERFYQELLLDIQAAEELAEQILSYKLDYWDAALEAFGPRPALISEADDYGSDFSLMVSPQVLKRVYFPRWKELFRVIKKKNPQAKIFFHCDGAIKDIIPDLIRMGVEILNPVQYTASGMELAGLKRDFGRELIFWGGGIDTRHILPSGRPWEVRDEVKRVLEIMAPGGGYVFSTIHNIQADVPVDNLLAMLDALRNFGAYPVRPTG